MEEELLVVWNYYTAAFDKQEVISPSRKKMGLAILRRLHEKLSARGNEWQCVSAMVAAIDMAHFIVNHNPKKADRSKWTSIFARWNTFATLYRTLRD